MSKGLQAYLEAPHTADILVVDDTLENVVLLAQILEDQGYGVRKAISAALARTAIDAVLPDLILLDICMPDIDGYTLCQQLKADPVTADIPVIFLSALSEALDKVKAFEVGGADYITKPFQAAEVLVRTRNQLMLARSWETLQTLNVNLEGQVKERTRELELANHQLMQLAYHDALTGLPNRALLMESLTRSLESLQADPDFRFAVLFCDCDRFKLINDSYGHLVGDNVLVQVSQRLLSCITEDDVLARFSGDEFVVLLNRVKTQQDAIDVAQKLIDVMKPSLALEHGEAFISLSVGIVMSHPVQHQKPEHMLRDADISMYNAKANGKGCYSVFNPVMQRASVELLQVETDLHRALAQNEFVPYYQPLVHLKTEQIVGLEVLVRWQHPERGLLLPHAFMSVAEETGLIVPMGWLLLKSACQQLAQWQQQALVNDDFYISFNFSVSQITQSQLPERLTDILADAHLHPKHVRLEITETALLDNMLATDVITQLSRQGFHLCIDDFGTGYSSLSYLHQLPVTTLKIDRSFIHNILPGNRNMQIVTAILGIVKTLSMIAVAEGIETREQLALLKQLDCEIGQGYLFSEPCSAGKIAQRFLEKSARGGWEPLAT